MSKMQILAVVVCVSVVLATFAKNAQARPGPTIKIGEESLMKNPGTEESFTANPAKEESLTANPAKEESLTANPGEEESVKINPKKELSDHAADVLKKSDATDALPIPVKDTASEEDSGEENEVICSEEGKCYEKRLLTATIDYKNDGPNNPITDPPH